MYHLRQQGYYHKLDHILVLGTNLKCEVYVPGGFECGHQHFLYVGKILIFLCLLEILPEDIERGVNSYTH